MAISGNTVKVAGLPSSWRPPWLLIQMAAAQAQCDEGVFGVRDAFHNHRQARFFGHEFNRFGVDFGGKRRIQGVDVAAGAEERLPKGSGKVNLLMASASRLPVAVVSTTTTMA